MKSLRFVLTLLSLISLSSCSTSSNNAYIFNRAESFYQTVKDCEFDYIDCRTLSDDEKGDISFYTNRDGEIEKNEDERVIKKSVETPLSIGDKKYCLSDFFALDDDKNANIKTIYASQDFSDALDCCIANSSFSKPNNNQLTNFVTAYSSNNTYYIYRDGHIGKDYDDGVYISESTLPMSVIFFEYLNLVSLREKLSGYDFEQIFEGDDNDCMSHLQYGDKKIEKKNLKDYLLQNVSKKCYSTYLINKVQFDYSKMIHISVVYYDGEAIADFYLAKNGMIVAGYYGEQFLDNKQYHTMVLPGAHSYRVFFPNYINTDAIFALFE